MRVEKFTDQWATVWTLHSRDAYIRVAMSGLEAKTCVRGPRWLLAQKIKRARRRLKEELVV